MTPATFPTLRFPIVQAPMGGGPSTPALAAAVSGVGGLGFLAAGYRSVDEVRTDIADLRSRLRDDVLFGVNVFAPPGHGADGDAVAGYAEALAGEASRMGVQLGSPRWDDDHYREKLTLMRDAAVPIVSFTFGCPTAADVGALHGAGSAVWVTVTSVQDAQQAVHAGADALVVQGVEAGGHRGSFDPDAPGDIGLIALLQLIAGDLLGAVPLVATGGIASGRGVAAVLAAGAVAAQLGTAFLLCPEAGTSAAHREAITHGATLTAVTRAFTGRPARGIENRFQRDHTAGAPSAYPQVHHLTAPLRAAARARHDADMLHLWAGQGYPLARSVPAADLVVQLTDTARSAAQEAIERLQC